VRDQSGQRMIGLGAWLLCAPACVMIGYDPSPAASSVVAAPPAGSGSNGSGSDQDAGSDQSGSRATGNPGTGGTGSADSGSGAASAQDAGLSLPTIDCEGRANGSACEDGLACTTGEACLAGECVGGLRKLCLPSGTECVDNLCDEDFGDCVNRPVDDGTVCGLAGTRMCLGGLCVSATGCDATAGAFCNLACNAGIGTCGLLCGESASCQADCDDSLECHVDCGGSDACWSVCAENSLCTVNCAGRAACHMLCQAGADCRFDCTDVVDCTDIDCDDGASCTLICGDSTACEFNECSVGQQTCPGNVVACGDCPS